MGLGGGPNRHNYSNAFRARYEDSIAFWEVIGNIDFQSVQARRLREMTESVKPHKMRFRGGS